MSNIKFLNINYKNTYIIHKYGFLLNLSTGHIYTPKMKTNKIHIVTKSFKCDKLIYTTFNNMNYKNKIYLIHKDGNILNNNLDNLKLVDKVTYNNYMQNINYKDLNYIILYKKYDIDFNLLYTYTNHKYIPEINLNLFLYQLLNEKIIYKDNYIWECEIIKIDRHNTNNYTLINNTNYKISIDNTHIINKHNIILKYNKRDNLNREYIEINNLSNEVLKIYYKYKDIHNNDFLFRDFIKKFNLHY